MLTETIAILGEIGWRPSAAFGIALLLAYLVTFPVRIFGQRMKILDKPGHRSSHTTVVPRTGGIAIILAMVPALALTSETSTPFVIGIIAALFIAAISFIDDVITIPSIPRLLAHLLAAGVVIKFLRIEMVELDLFGTTVQLPYWLALIVPVVFVAGFTNFFNFMDGINGIAAIQGLFGGLTIAILLHMGGGTNRVLAAAALAGACAGFIPHNFPRARIFMGDAGSTILGFLLAMLAVMGARHVKLPHVPFVALVMPLGLFIYDTVFTLFKRVLRRENFLKAHREHHYQLLVRCGWSHIRVTLIQAGLMLLCSVAALTYAWSPAVGRICVLAGLLSVFVTYSVLVHRYFRKHGLDHQLEKQTEMSLSQ